MPSRFVDVTDRELTQFLEEQNESFGKRKSSFESKKWKRLKVTESSYESQE